MAEGTQAVDRGHLLNDKLYFVLNSLALVIFPAVGTLYFALAQIWGLPGAQEVIGTLVAVDTFLGVVVKVGQTSYKNSENRFDGAINIEHKDDGGKTFQLDVSAHPMVLAQKPEITLKVNKPSEPLPAAPVTNMPSR